MRTLPAELAAAGKLPTAGCLAAAAAARKGVVPLAGTRRWACKESGRALHNSQERRAAAEHCWDTGCPAAQNSTFGLGLHAQR